MDGWMDGWTHGWMDGWTDGHMDSRLDGRIDGRIDGQMVGRMDRMDRIAISNPFYRTLLSIGAADQLPFETYLQS